MAAACTKNFVKIMRNRIKMYHEILRVQIYYFYINNNLILIELLYINRNVN